MIIVTVKTTVERASEEARRAAKDGCVVELAALPASGDGLLAVSDGRIVGAHRILGDRTSRGQRVCSKFEASSSFTFLSGLAVPVEWNVNKDHAQLSVIYTQRGTDEVAAARRRRRAASALVARTDGSRTLSSDRARVAGHCPGAVDQPRLGVRGGWRT